MDEELKCLLTGTVSPTINSALPVGKNIKGQFRVYYLHYTYCTNAGTNR